jgi:hypothetical protein
VGSLFWEQKAGQERIKFQESGKSKKCFKKEIVQPEEIFGRLPNVEFMVTQQCWTWPYCNIDMVK